MLIVNSKENFKKLFLTICILIPISVMADNIMTDIKYNDLTPEEERVIVHKGTELPYSGKYNKFTGNGIYICKRCSVELYNSEDKFSSSCGWPSFDDEIEGAVKKQIDEDGIRTEILCTNCGAHLGHVFEGESLTDKNIRHCVNSISLNFILRKNLKKIAKAYFAGGCFWGVEYYFETKNGVISVSSGYMGGTENDPTYQEVCSGNTGHLEIVEVTYDPSKISYEKLAEFFFEIHDPTQSNGQGPDIGEQYHSAIFYNNDKEKEVAEELITRLKNKKYDVVTELLPADEFWKAEEYHQDYYKKTGKRPYCHIYTKRF